MSITHVEGQAIVSRALPSATAKESLVLRALSGIESGYYGNGWRAFTPEQIARWGDKLKTDGRGSNNWGAITDSGKWPGGTFDHPDHYMKDGKRVDYVAKFRKYPAPEDGAIDLYKVAFKPNVKVATALGDLVGISRAMKDNNYYGGKYIEGAAREKLIQDHAGKLSYYIGNILSKTGEPDPFIVVGPPVSSPMIEPWKLLVITGIFLFVATAILKGPEHKPKARLA